MSEPSQASLDERMEALRQDMAVLAGAVAHLTRVMEAMSAQSQDNNKRLAALVGYRIPEDPGTYTVIQEAGHA